MTLPLSIELVSLSQILPVFIFICPNFIVGKLVLKFYLSRSDKKWDAPFEFALRCAVLCNDAFSKYTYVFLVPDEGYSNIVKLHDRLYTGIIASELRLDIPFIPHIGIANSLDAHHCKQLVDRLNGWQFEIRGRIDRLGIISSQGDLVEMIESINLG